MSTTKLLLPYLGRWNQFRKSRFHQIAERLGADKFEIHVLQAPKTESDEVLFRERDIELPDGVILHEANLSEFLWNGPVAHKVFQKGYYGLGTYRQISKIAAEHDINALWLYNLPHYPIAMRTDLPIVFDYVDDYVAMLNSELPVIDNPVSTTVVEYLFGQMLSRADLATCISHELESKVNEMTRTPPPCSIVPNGVDEEIFPVNRSIPQPEIHSPPTVGFVGSFEYFIDFEMILKAANRLPEVQFLLVGDGREFDSVKRLVKEWGLSNVEFTGLIESHEVPSYIEKMDICLNTFKLTPVSHSAVPLKLFEYLSMCKPVVSTRLREVQRIDSGYLRYADGPESLAETIRTIIEQYDQEAENIHQVRDDVMESYSWETIANTFESEVSRVLTS